MNFYEILGVAKDATPAQIRAAYKRAIARAHPDRKGGDPSLASQINQAYDVLMNEQRRLRYDQTGDAKLSDIEAGARDLLTSCFLTWLSSEGDDNNPLRSIETFLIKMKISHEETLNQLRHNVARAQHRLKKLKSKSSWLIERLEAEISKALEAKATIKEQLETTDLARKLLKDFSFEEEVQKHPASNYLAKPGGWEYL